MEKLAVFFALIVIFTFGTLMFFLYMVMSETRDKALKIHDGLGISEIEIHYPMERLVIEFRKYRKWLRCLGIVTLTALLVDVVVLLI